MNTAFEKIMQRIANNSAAFTESNLIAPLTIDTYQGQPIAPEQFEFALPAIFIDYMADYSNEKLYIYLHVLQDYAEDTENFSQDRANGMRFNEFLTTIKRLLNGMRIGGAFGALKLHQELPIQTEFFYYHQLTFVCTLNNDLYARTVKYIDANPVVPVFENGKLKDNTKGV